MKKRFTEEQKGGVTMNQYVWSPMYIDAMIERDRDSDLDGTLDERLYPTYDANFNVTGLVDSSGTMVEHFVYDPYGNVSYLDPGDWHDVGSSLHNWVYLHQGGRLDTSAGLYEFRHRGYDPTLATWVQQDSLQYANGSNLYQYLGGNPLIHHDPSGQSWYDGWGDALLALIGEADPQVQASFDQGVNDGFFAWANGLVPFTDPFDSSYFFEPCDPMLAWSEFLGEVSQDAWLAALMAMSWQGPTSNMLLNESQYMVDAGGNLVGGSGMPGSMEIHNLPSFFANGAEPIITGIPSTGEVAALVGTDVTNCFTGACYVIYSTFDASFLVPVVFVDFGDLLSKLNKNPCECS